MNQWAFVLAAYGIVTLTTVMLVVISFRSMRKAEGDAEAAKRRP